MQIRASAVGFRRQARHHKLKISNMQISKHISVIGLILFAFVFMSALVFFPEGDRHYWILLLFLPLLLMLVWKGMRKQTADIGD